MENRSKQTSLNHARRNVQSVALDLFSGCGGLTTGLTKAGFHVALAVESDRNAALCYRANHPHVSLIEKDIREVSVREIRRVAGGDVALVAGCPPCQGFSRISTRNAPNASRDKANSLYLEFLRIVKGIKPEAVMLENVPLFGRGSRFRRFRQELRRAGYSLYYGVLNVADFGVPQRRYRLIVLGVRGRIAPKPAPAVQHRTTVAEAIGFISKRFLSRDPLHNLPQLFSKRVRRRIREIPRNGGSRKSLSKSRSLKCHQDHDGFFDVYGRMRWNDVAPTITAGIYSPSKGRYLHPRNHRCVSLREAAVLQGFPLSYKFPVEIGKIRLASLIGNALPPEFVKRHAVQLKQAIRRE